jgi:hypothetical protein
MAGSNVSTWLLETTPTTAENIPMAGSNVSTWLLETTPTTAENHCF